MGEVIYGIDFRAGKEEAPLCNAPDVPVRDFAKVAIDANFYFTWPDTAPSEYCADDSGDCA